MDTQNLRLGDPQHSGTSQTYLCLDLNLYHNGSTL